jgi:hypothetical protein
MKKLFSAALAIGMMAGLSGCSYGGVAAAGDKVVINKNDLFLFGALRKVYVCKVTDGGVTQCNSSSSP